MLQAAHELQDRGLVHSACWAAEQLAGLRDDGEGDLPAVSLPLNTTTPAERDSLLLAKTYFDAEVEPVLLFTSCPFRCEQRLHKSFCHAPCQTCRGDRCVSPSAVDTALICRSTTGRRMR